MNRPLAFVALIIAVAFGISFFQDQSAFHRILLKTSQSEYELKVEFAKTPDEQRRGLMERQELKEGRGMLFIYGESLILSFWMKNTLIPLDMIFIGSDLTIKYIEHDAPPCPPDQNCPMYLPPEPVQYVLEVPGGYTRKYNINVGDVLSFD